MSIDRNDFFCINCQKKVVYCDAMVTAHRNHCPFCLWSKHVDENIGDRAAICEGPMEPVGLTMMNKGLDKYGKRRQGELMLIHQCKNCGKISINRIAADDDEKNVLEVYKRSWPVEGKLEKKLKKDNISILNGDDKEMVQKQLYGDI